MGTQVAAFFDLDNTLLRGSSIYYIARGLLARRLLTPAQLRAFLVRQFRWVTSNSENLNDVASIFSDVQGMLAGQSVAEITQMGREIYEERMADKLWPETLVFVREHQEQGHDVYVVTAAGQEMADLIAEELDLTGALGTRSEILDGVYTGSMAGDPMHGPAKAAAISRLAEERGISLPDSFAYSDSFNDVPMLELVGNPVVVNPDDELLALAQERGWPIHEFRGRRLAARATGGIAAVTRVAARSATATASTLAAGAWTIGRGR
mgnify:CR=1 FL=1